MFRQFTRSDPTEVAALMGNHTWGLPVEDHSTVILRSPKAVCTVESGYNSVAPGIHFSVRTRRGQIVLRNDDTIEVYDAIAGGPTLVPTRSTSNVYWYGPFVRESLDRFARGEGPIADLDDLVGAMRIVDAAYAADRASAKTANQGQ
jgi:predicted dehydrogenase